MMKKQNSEITCPYKSANVNRSPQQLQSFSTPPIRQIVKHGLATATASLSHRGCDNRAAESQWGFFNAAETQTVCEACVRCHHTTDFISRTHTSALFLRPRR